MYSGFNRTALPHWTAVKTVSSACLCPLLMKANHRVSVAALCTQYTDLYLGLYAQSVVLSVYRALLKPEIPVEQVSDGPVWKIHAY